MDFIKVVMPLKKQRHIPLMYSYDEKKKKNKCNNIGTSWGCFGVIEEVGYKNAFASKGCIFTNNQTC